jgi:multidrug efflux pump subunit AcrA (membrane-fusion protein)
VVEARPVRLGPREGESVAVKGGLKEGDRAVVGGLAGLRAGMAVKARPATSGKKER